MRAATFTTVCSDDPEIDTTKIDVETFGEFLRNRVNLDSIRHAFSTVGPTRFVIREIPESLWDFVDEAPTDELKYKRAFMCGVMHAENVVQSDGSRLGSVGGRDTVPNGSGQADIMKPDDLRYFSRAERLEIGSVAYTHSFLHRKIASAFRLPPMCLRRLRERDFRSADASPISPATPSEESSEQEAP